MKKNFITGLLILLPLIVTYMAFKFGMDVILGPFEQIVRYFLMHLALFKEGIWHLTPEQVIIIISQICIILAIFGLIVLVGIFLRRVFFHSLIFYFDRTIRKVPIIKSIYGPIKDLIDALFSAKAEFVRKAVIAPFPSMNQKTIGIATGEYVAVINGKEEAMVSVFFPTTPNAGAGYLCSYLQKEVQYLDMSADAALKSVMFLKIELPHEKNRI